MDKGSGMTRANLNPRKATAPKRVSVLGSTGSIGKSTLDLLARQKDAYKVEALAARNNVDLLVQQCLEFRPAFVAIEEESHFPQLQKGLEGTGIEMAAGPEAVIEAARQNTDWTISAIVGAAAVLPTLAAIRRGGTIALANKECLVCAGDILMAEVRKHGATLLPVDSEHNAIFQAFDFEKPETVEKITLTASGGPFRTLSRAELANVTAKEAIRHPNWNMGAKISVDSATMMNKGLEVIEAYHLFPLEENQIDVVIHPESIIHGLVHYRDGSVLAGMSPPDMRVPIAHSLAWPGRIETPTARLDLTTIGRLTFEAPDEERFPALRLAREALIQGGAAPAILNAANEVAVMQFIEGKIAFLSITALVSEALGALAGSTAPKSVEDVIELDFKTRDYVNSLINKLKH
jgi:1-deoxy-D-xylulose-5-phosphate reductoisomerase